MPSKGCFKLLDAYVCFMLYQALYSSDTSRERERERISAVAIRCGSLRFACQPHVGAGAILNTSWWGQYSLVNTVPPL